MGKASLAFAVIVAVVITTGVWQAMDQISNASVDQYLTQVGEDASTTSQDFRESRSECPDALVTPDTSSDTYSDAANTPSASMSGTTRDTPTALLGAAATTTVDDVEAGGG